MDSARPADARYAMMSGTDGSASLPCAACIASSAHAPAPSLEREASSARVGSAQVSNSCATACPSGRASAQLASSVRHSTSKDTKCNSMRVSGAAPTDVMDAGAPASTRK
ncbi:MAG: hypothetical protein EOO41_00470 [Methanobacteriota archaeon]|nr:MAG: hypothetical protein EOO41_00470 [Euryarchaeota archaeon]